MSELALRLIAENKKTRNPVLDLGNCGLTEFPMEVLECNHLKELNFKTTFWDSEAGKEIVSNNEGFPNLINDIPDLKLLYNLKTLRVGGFIDSNKVIHSDKFIWGLQSIHFVQNILGLHVLDISGCKVSDLGPLKQLTKLTTLDLAGNQVSNLASLQTLTNLTALDFKDNYVSDLEPLQALVKLKTLDFGFNEISSLKSLKVLSRLISIDFSYNHASDLGPLQSLKNLTSLSFKENRVFDLGPLQSLTSLTSLNFSYNQVSDLGPLQSLTSLTSLDFSSNKVSDLRPLQSLSNLLSLNFSSNKVSDLRPLKELTSLSKLSFSDNQISDLRPLKELTSLSKLSFSDNQVSDLRTLKEFTNLTELYLGSNKVSDLGPLQSLTSLTSLYFSGNQVSDLGQLQALTKLTSLNFSRNQVSDLRPILTLFQNVNCIIDADDNPLKDPPYEVYKAGRQKIIDHFSIKRKVPLDQVKCIFLGNSTTGKTSLIRFLVYNEYSTSEVTITTHGIDQHEWRIQDENYPTLKPLHVNIWDFGGQHYYHSMHRLFLTRGAVYVLVCNKILDVNQTLPTNINHEVNGKIISEVRLVEHFNYEYWLNSIGYFDKRVTSDKISKVFPIENKAIISMQKSEHLHLTSRWLEQPEMSVESFKQINIKEVHLKNNATSEAEKKIDQRYLNNYDNFERDIKEALFNQVSGSETHFLFPQIRDYIRFWANQELTETEEFGLGNLFPGLQMKGMINRQRQLPFVSDEAFQQLIRELTRSEDYDGLSFKSYYDLLLIYLDAMSGCVTFFPDIHFQPQQEESIAQDGKGMVCLQPEWLHQAIFKILDPNVVKDGKSFTLEHIDKQIPGGGIEARYMVNILKDFDLIFEYQSIVPFEERGKNKAIQTTGIQTKQTFYISPHTLPLAEPENLLIENRDLELSLTFQFPDYFPPDSIARFIAREAELAEIETLKLWKYGILYFNEFNSTKTMVRAERAKNEIQIYLPAGVKEKIKNRFLRRFFQTYFLDICKGNQDVKIKLTENVACRWGDLENANKEVRTESGEYINKEPYDLFLPEKGKPKVRIFISYSHRQREAAKVFINLLRRTLKVEKVEIVPFIDLEIPLGELWHEYLKDKVDECDLLICLLSNDFLESEYIKKYEYGPVLEKIRKGHNIVEIALIHFEYLNAEIDSKTMSMQIYPSFPEDAGWKKGSPKYFCASCHKGNHYRPNKNQKIFVENLVDKHLNSSVLRITEKKLSGKVH